MNPEFAKKLLIGWSCMLIGICVVFGYLISQIKRDEEWCFAHELATYAQTHLHVLCEDAVGFRARPGDYPVANGIWIRQ
jgi:hypothetical protein